MGFLHTEVTEEGHGGAYGIEGRLYYLQVPRGRGMPRHKEWGRGPGEAPGLVRTPRVRTLGTSMISPEKNEAQQSELA